MSSSFQWAHLLCVHWNAGDTDLIPGFHSWTLALVGNRSGGSQTLIRYKPAKNIILPPTPENNSIPHSVICASKNQVRRWLRKLNSRWCAYINVSFLFRALYFPVYTLLFQISQGLWPYTLLSQFKGEEGEERKGSVFVVDLAQCANTYQSSLI